jgi:hypothetical protein
MISIYFTLARPITELRAKTKDVRLLSLGGLKLLALVVHRDDVPRCRGDLEDETSIGIDDESWARGGGWEGGGDRARSAWAMHSSEGNKREKEKRTAEGSQGRRGVESEEGKERGEQHDGWRVVVGSTR